MQRADLLILIVIAVLTAFIYAGVKFRRKRLDRKYSDLSRSQKKAAEVLEQEGFKIVDWHKDLKITVSAGKSTYIDLHRRDFLVKKGFRKYPAKVLTGHSKSSIKYNSRVSREIIAGKMFALGRMRRIIFVDVEKKSLKLIKMKLPVSKKRLFAAAAAFAVTFLLGMVSALVVWWYLI